MGSLHNKEEYSILITFIDSSRIEMTSQIIKLNVGILKLATPFRFPLICLNWLKRFTRKPWLVKKVTKGAARSKQ